MKRLLRLLPAVLVLASAGAAAQGAAYEPKALARYDVSYSRCETDFPAMKGHGDEAYLSLWRGTLNDKARAQLANARASAPYKAERKLAARAAAAASAPAEKKTLEQQCKGLWGEMARTPKVQ